MSLLIVFIMVWALSPGPVAVMTLHKAKKQGYMSGVAVACGATLTSALMVIAALLIHFLGFNAISDTSEFIVIERLGAFGIIVMGLYAGYKSLGFVKNQDDTPEVPTNHRLGFIQGMMIMATYIPQAVIFYTVIVPQSISTESILPVIIGLGSLKVALILVWHSLIAVMATKAQRWLDNQRVGKGLDVATACLLVGLGINILI